MDRSWMKKVRWETAYEDGVEEFLALAYRDLPQDSEILCPLRTHLRCDGILQGYTTWVHHGENYDRPSIAFVDVLNITTLPALGIVQDCRDGESDSMQEPLHATFGRAAGMPQGEANDFQSGFADMEHNAPEDIVNLAQGDDSGRDQNIYARFLKDAHIRLYLGCKYSRLSFLVHLYHLKCLNGWSQELFAALPGLLSAALPL
uniref:Transposase-associated domain-containing protein n=1 Tax=Setaria italica TaxID=4555 RepID=K3ZM31_SETIT